MASLIFVSGPSSQGSSNTAKFYDEVYFDSSESSDEGEKEEGGAAEDRSTGRVGPRKGRKSGSSKKVKKLTNDELFYDPDLDDQNEKWMNRQRMAYHNGEVCLVRVCLATQVCLVRRCVW